MSKRIGNRKGKKPKVKLGWRKRRALAQLERQKDRLESADYELEEDREAAVKALKANADAVDKILPKQSARRHQSR